MVVVCVLRWGRWGWRPGGSSLVVSSCWSDGGKFKPGGEGLKLALDALVTWR